MAAGSFAPWRRNSGWNPFFEGKSVRSRAVGRGAVRNTPGRRPVRRTLARREPAGDWVNAFVRDAHVAGNSSLSAQSSGPPHWRQIHSPLVANSVFVLLADFQATQQIKIQLRIGPLHVIQQSATTADHSQQTAPAGMILDVKLQVSGHVSNSRGQDRNLYLGRTGVRAASSVLTSQFLLTLFRDRHAVFASVYCRVRAWGRRRGTIHYAACANPGEQTTL